MFRSIISKRKMLTILTVLFVVFIAFSIQTKLVVAQEHTDLIFEENFEDGKIDGLHEWGARIFSSRGDTKVIDDDGNKVLSATGDIEINFGEDDWEDYTIKTRIKIVKYSLDSWEVAIRSRQKPDQSYDLGFRKNRVGVYKVTRNIWTDLAFKEYSFLSDRWYDFKIELKGNRIKAYVDEKLIFDITDSDNHFTSGHFSLVLDTDTTAYFDDVQVLASQTAVKEHTALLFEDDFEDGNANGWYTWGGSWNVEREDSNWVYSGTGGEIELDDWARARTGDETWTDYTFETKVKILKARAGGIIQLSFRESEAHGGRYIIELERNKILLKKDMRNVKSQGTVVDLTTAFASLSLDTWYTVKIVANGGKLEVYIDDIQKIDYTDSTEIFTSGRIWIEVSPTSHVRFDDLQVVTSSTLPTTTTLLTTTPAPTTTVPPTTTPAPTTTSPPITTPAPTTIAPIIVSRSEVVDSDGDGWSDELEKRIGSNPFQQDSDGDGIIDSKDPNPLKYGGEMGTDSDGDGWSDDLEKKAGTDPFDKDTDGDGMWDSKDPNPLIPQGEENGINWEAIGVGLAVLAASGGWIVTNRKKSRMKRLLDDIDKTYESFKMNSRRCEAELYRHRSVVSEQLKNGKIDEESYSILDKRLDDYLKEIKQRIMEERLPPKCPSCGSPFQGKDGDKCEYCGSVVRREGKIDK